MRQFELGVEAYGKVVQFTVDVSGAGRLVSATLSPEGARELGRRLIERAIEAECVAEACRREKGAARGGGAGLG